MKDRIKRLAEKNKVCEAFINLSFLISGVFVSIICIILGVFPINEKKIVCSSWKGKRYGDNPKYISDKIIEKYPTYEVAWILNKDFEGEIPVQVRRVSNSYLRQLYELVTARVWIDSSTKQFGLRKRKGQLYVQTWHGSYGIKKLYGDIPDKLRFIEKTYMQYNSKMIDLMISNSAQTSQIYHRALWYSGEILEYGSPKNDIFFVKQSECKNKVNDYFGIKEKKIAIYAPTFRNNLQTNHFNIDYKRLLKALENKFGEQWIILIRLHPHNLVEAEKFVEYDDKVINASIYNDMQELLVAGDILITDYSSCMFDFVTNKKICFLYATDVKEYKKERDYYFDIEDLPFPLAQNNEEMEQNILNFDEQKYEEKLDKLFEQVGLAETGWASEKTADYIVEWMEKD